MTEDDIAYYVEVPGVYDGWSIAVRKDGTIQNRWTGPDGGPLPGYERRWKATEDAIDQMEVEDLD